MGQTSVLGRGGADSTGSLYVGILTGNILSTLLADVSSNSLNGDSVLLFDRTSAFRRSFNSRISGVSNGRVELPCRCHTMPL